jgi:FkbM family methyltransferase
MASLKTIGEKNEAALRHRAEELRKNRNAFQDLNIRGLRELPAYAGFVEAAFCGDLTFVMFLCDGDDGVSMRLLWKQQFEPASVNIWRVLVQDAELVLDVGGHTGIYSIVAGLTKAQCEIHTFEPHEMNVGRLLLNLRANGLQVANVHNLAASATNGQAPFNAKVSFYLLSGGAIAPEGATYTKMVQTRRIDDVVRPRSTARSCVKIDTEGHEAHVLEGMPNLLALKPDIILECALVPGMAQAEQHLLRLGYEFYVISDSRFELQKVSGLSSPPPGITVKERVNCWLAPRPESEVRGVFATAREAYRKAALRIGIQS